jgi:glycolate oxidase FAD binding subunit
MRQADALKALEKVCDDVRPGEPAEEVLGVVPRWVAAPSGTAEAAEVMRVAAEHGLAVVPRGGETRLDWRMPPERCDLLVDTHRLNRVVEHAAGDLVVTVEAGLPMERLAEVLAERDQRLSLDVPLPGSTVGGTIATGAAGPLRLLYGAPRDLVIGIAIVRADGRLARSGGKVVKNVAGYDLGRLLSGSYGTLGLIVEATFRLHPVPAARAYVTAALPDAASAHRAVQAVLHSSVVSVVPSALECVTTPDDGIALGVLLEGVPDGVSTRAAHVANLLGPQAQDIHSTTEAPGNWGRYPDGTTLIEVTAPPASLPDLLGAVPPDGALTWSASGHGHAGLPAGMAAEEVARMLSGLRGVLAGHNGGAVVCFAPEEVRDAIDLWGPMPALALMRRVKDQFDPAHRLSPGRFAGGIC